LRFLTTVLVISLLVALSACSGGTFDNGSETSELRVYNNLTAALISDEATTGTITLNVGDTRNLRVMRTVTDPDTGDTTTNETTTADYNVLNPSVVAVSESAGTEGVLTAISVGTTIVDVAFNDGDGDETDDDHTKINVVVNP
jgi:hypothetical protein